MIIPERFRTAVRAHMTRLDRRHDLYRHLSAPRVLCVQGPPGVGKSTQLGQCLRELGSPFLRLDTSQLGGQFEGDPVRELDQALASLRVDHVGGTRPTLLVDDLDVSLGVRAGRSYTVNNQLTCGWLMARADEVYEPGFGPAEPAIVVTGNDFSGVHGPLLRSGRARIFDYAPTPEEVAAVLEPIFLKHVDGPATELVQEFPDATVADVLEAVSSLRDRFLDFIGPLEANPSDASPAFPRIEAAELRRLLAQRWEARR